MSVMITRLDYSSAELRRLASRTAQSQVVRRLLALALVLDGSSREEAARAAGMDRQTLRDWVHRYNDAGVAGLSDRHGGGTVAKLTPDQEAEVAGWMRTGPDPEVDGIVRWRCVDLRGRIAQRFGVELHERTVGKLLTRLGFSRIPARPQHPKADLQAQASFSATSPPS